MCRVAIAASAVSLIFLFGGVPAALGQEPTLGGLVAEQGTLDPVEGAIVTLFRVAEDGSLVPTATSVTDEEGAFRFEAPAPGSYRIQAEFDGFTSPLSHAMAFSGEGVVDDLVLMVPSPLLLMAGRCDLEANPGAIVVGVVRDARSEVPVPGARVASRWSGPGGESRLEAESDARGYFLLCGVEPAGFVEFRAEALGRIGYWSEVEVVRPALVLHDLEVALGTAAPNASDPAIDFIMMEIAGTLGGIRGELRDHASGAPIAQAVVRLEGTRLQGLSDAEGKFGFPDLTPGVYRLQVQHLGYSVTSEEVTVPEGREVVMRMSLSPQAIALDEISVTARSRMEQDIRTSPFRRDVVAGRELAFAEERGATAVDVLRSYIPGLRVTEVYTETGTQLCIRTNRRIQSFTDPSNPQDRDPWSACPADMVLLVLDGTRIGERDAAQVVMGLPSSEIESIEFLQPNQAAILYGTGSRASNGVVVIWTRGRGPYVSPTRNMRP